jgi:hypothetical protein
VGFGAVYCVRFLGIPKPGDFVVEKYKYRGVLCGHKAVEAGAICLVLMVQGHLAEITLVHFAIATKTGLLAVFPALVVTFTQYARHFANRWTSSVFLGVCTFLADAIIHQSHYPGAYTEAVLTGIGACAFSVVVSYTPVGKRIERLAETFVPTNTAVPEAKVDIEPTE